ncbi:STE/STE11 protein kinase Mkh1 [Schizosaccharomyces japonicus yFS275]|uniref:mitogen-activated protein kinase kinase kinase n=1 Tax=Schizosaccharomyces japonicus (strain yFS275 / FY16936) TaxID=402676 RepID=B6K2V3_SCHJY|nr:STE/STE11 protein kinase Mkh1 [Schizosaccharomyces japonicus yFS275]EEB08593.1 STE/STE11 protein kinase Mkh1 [Schizosaccharomyces japonicus yFS275]
MMNTNRKKSQKDLRIARASTDDYQDGGTYLNNPLIIGRIDETTLSDECKRIIFRENLGPLEFEKFVDFQNARAYTSQRGLHDSDARQLCLAARLIQKITPESEIIHDFAGKASGLHQSLSFSRNGYNGGWTSNSSRSLMLKRSETSSGFVRSRTYKVPPVNDDDLSIRSGISVNSRKTINTVPINGGLSSKGSHETLSYGKQKPAAEKGSGFFRLFRFSNFKRDKSKDKEKSSLGRRGSIRSIKLKPSSLRTIGSSDANLMTEKNMSIPEEWMPRVHRLEADVGIHKIVSSRVLLTADDVHFTLVDITGIRDSSLLRQELLAAVGLSDIAQYSFYLTEIGGAQYIEELDDTKLLSVQKHADEKGSLKLFIKPTNSSHLALSIDSHFTEDLQAKASLGLNDGTGTGLRNNLTLQIPRDGIDFRTPSTSPISISPRHLEPDKAYSIRANSPASRFKGFEIIRGAKGEHAEELLDGRKNQSCEDGFQVIRPHKKVTVQVDAAANASSVPYNIIAHRLPPKPPAMTEEYRQKLRNSIHQIRTSGAIPSKPHLKTKTSFLTSDELRRQKSGIFKTQTIELDSETELESETNTAISANSENADSWSLFSNAPAYDESQLADDVFWSVKPADIEKEEKKAEVDKRIPSNGSTTSKESKILQPYPKAADFKMRRFATSHSFPARSRSDSYTQKLKKVNSFDQELRPSPDIVYENLEKFFPNHNLDELVVAESNETAQPSKVNHRRGHRKLKSIRLVAREAVEARQRLKEELDEQQRNVNILRRKSTKLWGSRIIEMKPNEEELEFINTLSPNRMAMPSPGITFRWVKGRLIGNGTYGRVYLAMNLNTGEMIAVKQVEVPQAISGVRDEWKRNIVEAINSEITMMSDLDHLNIVQYLGYEKSATEISIFLEYVPGGSVGRFLRKHGPFSERVTRYIIRQVLQGLSYLHSRGIIHRDLKADNLLLDFDGTCKISDFGISKYSTNIYGNDANMSMQGTIFWMAPEVIHNSHQGYSAKVDIWSLGCVVLEMLAGRRPWSNEEAVQAMFKLGTEKQAPPIPDDVKPHISQEVVDFLNACFTIDPEQRPTVDQLLQHPFVKQEHDENFKSSELLNILLVKDEKF